MSRGRFQAGDPRTIEAGRKGGQKLAEQRRKEREPFDGTVLDVMDAAGLTGPSWALHRALNKAVYALPMDAAELEFFRRHTERDTPPSEPVREAWLVVGRRGGKTRNMAVNAAFLGIRFNPERLAPGETAVIPVLAADRKQARQLFGYLRGLFALDEFAPYMHRELKETIELRTGVNIEVHTASYRTVRGYTCIAVCGDEIAFWRTDDGSANPDSEVLDALRPAMLTIPDAVLFMGSTPYAAKGELFKTYERSFGKDDPHVLVWNADTRSMNPSVPAHFIEREFEDDPVVAASEYGSDGRMQFRRDVEAFIDPLALRAVIVEGRRELEPTKGTSYVAFVDPSGGSQDSFTLAIAHTEGELAVLDAVREVRPPFSPDSVVQDFARLLKSYGTTRVKGDRYGGEWPREVFRKHGITYEPSELSKSDIYRELVAPLNAGRVALLDLPILRAQLLGLERRVSRGGKDSIDHAPGAHDDVANAAAGALVAALPAVRATRFVRAYSAGSGRGGVVRPRPVEGAVWM